MFSALLPALSLSLLASSAVAAPTDGYKASTWVKGKAFDRIAIIWLENTDYDLAAGDPSLAWLAKKGISLSNHFAVTHPSMPNYAAAISGDYYGINHDDMTAIPSNVSTLVDLLEAKGISWGAYQEDMPYTGFQGFDYRNQKTGANDYVRKHNPPVLYDSVADKASRLNQIKNLTLFHEELEQDALPQWMFITPNMTSDGHDSTVTVAGTWSKNFLEPLLNDKKFMKNTLVLLTFDENHTYTQQNRIVAILLGDAVPKNLIGSTDSNFYNHYSEIATVQANWGLDTLGRWDVGANVFDFVAKKTGDSVRHWSGKTQLSQMYWNVSYAGKLNNKNTSVPWPVPGTKLVHNGRKVADVVKKTWASLEKESAYTTALEVPDGLHPEPEFSRAKKTKW
ncbi:phosphoesterase-domain-containing protein [Bimuria novae-zelandiae CBS 107.79]|uniref:Phosphoesterase-domain-containing protein n=1 Tax=Bimuria novae-zelandiae CBS 107.79 TaxID=1447943 RepID=A0A6A5V8S1_9PLEO|nr:phosphoesterase-domain-containing protein [Bimuria novae-zelandiae CBS 107.79]